MTKQKKGPVTHNVIVLGMLQETVSVMFLEFLYLLMVCFNKCLLYICQCSYVTSCQINVILSSHRHIQIIEQIFCHSNEECTCIAHSIIYMERAQFEPTEYG